MADGKKSAHATTQAGKAKRRAGATTEVSVTFRHLDPTDALRQYAERKLGRVGKFLKRPAQAHLILTVDKYRQLGEVTVRADHFTMTAQEETKDLYAVIDLLSDKLERQIKHHNGKLTTRRQRPSAAQPREAEPAEPRSH